MTDFEYIVKSQQFLNSSIGDDHWLWGGAVTGSGYGALGRRSVHVASYAYFHGDIPKGLHVMHTCDVRLCFRPSHLTTGTRYDNMQDMITKRRGNTVRLTPDQVREIRDRYVRSGYNRSNKRELAREFNVAPGTIKRIISRNIWGWID